MLNVPSHPDLRKIIVINPKGGAGKTTLATNLAGLLTVQGERVALMDCDPQGSSMRWLQKRDRERPAIHGIAAYEHDDTMTRSFRMRVPPEVRYLVVDTPAALPVHELVPFTRGAHAILVPVLPSDIDIHAATRLISDLLLVAKVSRRMGRLAVVANRVRENTLGYRKLTRFLERLSIATVGELRDSQNYVHAADEGISIHEMHPPSRARRDTERWAPLSEWLNQRLATPLTGRDLHAPPPDAARLSGKSDLGLPGGALPSFAFSGKE
jgi:chromosome partitioning protein